MSQDKDNAQNQEQEGKQLYAAGKYKEAGYAFSQAAKLYLAQEQNLLAAEMRNNQSVALLQAKNPQEALAAVQGTGVIFEEAGDQLKQAMAYANEATALEDLGQNVKAIEMYTHAADLFAALNETEMQLQVRQSISALKLKSRNLIGAFFSMQEGLEQIEKPNLRQRIFLKLLKIPQRLLNK
jgi:tetratricopeptide (TPR) repeat protein